MALPLPSVIANVGPGGSIVSSLAGINALRKSMLENQYYGPNIQSEIANRNALTNKYNTMTPLEAEQLRINNQYLPEHLRAANVFSNLQNQYYAPNILSEIANRNALTNKYNVMTPLEAKALQLSNQYYGPNMESQIASRNAGTTQTNIQNQFLPESLRLGNEEATLKNKYYAPKTEADIAQSRALTNKYNVMTPLEAREAMIRNYFLPENLKAANTLANLNNQYFVPKTEADIAQTRALTDKYNQMTPLEIEAQKLRNQFYPELTKSQIASYKALADARKFGGIGGGVAQKADADFRKTIQLDYPNFTPEQVYEASNVLKNGGNQLSDGTPVALSPNSQDALSRVVLGTTSKPLVTGNIQAAQSDAEIDALAKHAQEALRPYGDTVANYSPKQILDTFKTDKESQERLGKFIAGKQLQYEIAQNQIRLANGKPGITSTQELMDLGMQNIKASYPRLSAIARETAQNYFIEGLKKGLKARQGVNIAAANVYGDRPKMGANKSSAAPKATLRYNPQTGDFEEIK